MNFMDIIENYKRIAIVGTFKNAGKTVALNEFINNAVSKGKILGITSIGRDGERKDIVTNTEKPPIFVPAGTIIATAETCAVTSEAPLEIINVTPFQTAIGRVVIGKVKEAGFVEIAGPDSNSEIKKVCNIMCEIGAEVILIDGALNRKTQASPALADGVILSTGAVLGRSIDVVVDKTVHTVRMLTLPKVEAEVLEICEEAATSNHVSFIDKDKNIINTHFKTALGCANKIMDLIKADYEYIVIPGTVMNSFVKSMHHVLRNNEIKLVVQDGTKVFIEPMDYRIFEKLGGRIMVIDSINLLAVTINPYSPEGYNFEPAFFYDAMKEALSPLDVFDCVQEGSF
jgi:hypothetical protein